LHVDGLKNRLEALSSPQLVIILLYDMDFICSNLLSSQVSAFNSMDVERSAFFVKIFANMDRSSELLKYYRKCTRAKLLKVTEYGFFCPKILFSTTVNKI